MSQVVLKKIRVGLIGAGFAAQGFALQCLQSSDISLIAVSNRTPQRAKQMVGNQESVIITDDPNLLIHSSEIDVIVEATGNVAFGAYIATETIKAGKHILVINAELDATLGPILKKKADDAGVIYTQADGDQPGVIMNLIREVELLGMTPVMAGNIKTFFDKYRTPDTQKEWATRNEQSTTLATSAVDGTKLAAEMASVANATGFKVAVRGMMGPKARHVQEAPQLFQKMILENSEGIIDFILGAEPAFGVFVLATTDRPLIKKYLKMYKMGDGPLYLLHRPYHLCTLEAHKSVIEACRYGRATLAPNQLSCEVVAVAKRDILPGEILDGIGGFMTYGEVENSNVVQQEKFLPIGLSEGCTALRPIRRDEVIRFKDVKIPAGRNIDILYAEQKASFSL